MRNIRAVFRRHPALAAAFTLALALTVFFAVRFASEAIYWSAHRDEPVRPWMTVGYVGRSWGLPPRLIDETAGLPLPANDRPFTLQEIATERGVPVEHIIQDVEKAIAKLKAERRHD